MHAIVAQKEVRSESILRKHCLLPFTTCNSGDFRFYHHNSRDSKGSGDGVASANGHRRTGRRTCPCPSRWYPLVLSFVCVRCRASCQSLSGRRRHNSRRSNASLRLISRSCNRVRSARVTGNSRRKDEGRADSEHRQRTRDTGGKEGSVACQIRLVSVSISSSSPSPQLEPRSAPLVSRCFLSPLLLPTPLLAIFAESAARLICYSGCGGSGSGLLVSAVHHR